MRARRFFDKVSAGLFGAALGETIAIAVHLEDADMVGDMVEQSAGETLRSQGLDPFRMATSSTTPFTTMSWKP